MIYNPNEKCNELLMGLLIDWMDHERKNGGLDLILTMLGLSLCPTKPFQSLSMK